MGWYTGLWIIYGAGDSPAEKVFGLSAAGIEGGADNNRSRNKQLRPHEGNARAEQKEVLQNEKYYYIKTR